MKIIRVLRVISQIDVWGLYGQALKDLATLPFAGYRLWQESRNRGFHEDLDEDCRPHLVAPRDK